MLTSRLSRRFLLVCLLLSSAGLAEPPPEGADKQSRDPSSAEKISIEELPGRYSDIQDRLYELRAEIAGVSLFEHIDKGVVALEFELVEDEASLDQIELESVSLSRLKVFQTVWKAHQDRITLWRETLDARWRQWVQTRQELREEVDFWQAMQALAEVDEEIASSFGGRIEKVITSIEEVDRELKTKVEELLELGELVKNQQRRIRAASVRIESVEQHAFARMAQKDRSPIWQIAREGDHFSQGLFPLLRDTVSGELADILEHLWSRQVRLAAHVVLFALLLASFLALRRRSRVWEAKDEILRYSKLVLSRPVASASVLGLLATPWMYPDSPWSVIGLAILLSIVPMVVLLPGLLGEALRSGAYAFLLIFAFEIASNLTFGDQILRRFALLAVTLAGAGLSLWALTRLRGSDLWKPGVATLLVRLVVVCFAASMAVASVANVLGWSRLAEYLAQASYMSAYNGLVILVGFYITSGLIRAFPDTPTGRALRTISNHSDRVTSRAVGLVALFASLVWLESVVRRFHFESQVAGRFARFFEGKLNVGALEFSVGRILSALTVLFVAYLFARLLRFVLAEEILSRFDMRFGVVHAVATMVYYLILSTGLLAAASALGLGTDNLALMASALGIGIGFGLQNVVGNFVSGLILIFERPVKVGDLVEVGAILGYVGHIGIRSSTIRTFEGAEVVVPNSELVSKQVTNWTLSDLQRRRDFDVVVSWGTDPDRVIEILRETVESNQKVLPEPKPVVYFRGYEGGDLRFSLFFWTSIQGSLGTLSDVGLEVNRALVKAGIEVALPNRDVRIRGSIETGPALSKASEPTEKSS